MAIFNSSNGSFQSGNKTLFETQMLATSDGVAVDNTNPLPVVISGATFDIGELNINTPETQNVSFNDQSVIITGNVAGIDSTITVANGYQETQNVSFNDQSVTITGNIAGIDSTVIFDFVAPPDINGILSTVNVAYVTAPDINSIFDTVNVQLVTSPDISSVLTTVNVAFTTAPDINVLNTVNTNISIDPAIYTTGLPINGSVTVTDITLSVPLSVSVSGNVAGIDSTITIANGYQTTQNVSFNDQSITVTGNIAGIDSTITTAIKHSNGANITSAVPLPVTASIVNPVSLLYSFNNFGVFNHRGWSVSDTLIPMFSVRAKSTATHNVNIINYDIGNNNANQSTIGYIWIEDAVISGSVPDWSSLNTEAEYRFYTDAYGSNTPNGVSGGTQRHAGIIIGKNSSAEADIEDINMIAGGVTMTLCLIRLDSATKLDVWVAVDLAILS